MSSTSEIIAAYYLHLKNRDQQRLHEILADDIVVTYHSQPDQFPWSGEFHGKAGFDRFFETIKAHLNIIEVHILHSTVGEDRVVNQCQGIWEYIDNGYRVHGSMVNVFAVREGKIGSYEIYADTAAFAEGYSQQKPLA